MDTSVSPSPRQTWLARMQASRLCVKICGMRDPDNIAAIAQLQPTMLGFIFYPSSPRFMAETLAPSVIGSLPPHILRVGVFVNADLPVLLEQIERFCLHAVQLHGDESAEYASLLRTLRPDVVISKACGLSADYSFDVLLPFEASCDYFVFDTKTPHYGGSGQTFDWDILKQYRRPVPYLLSGGLSLSHLSAVRALASVYPELLGVDLNSRVEEQSGRKSPMIVQQCLELLRGESPS